MKRRGAPKTNKKFVVIGLLLELFLSLYYLSLQKKKEGMKEGRRDKDKKKKKNLSTEEKLRNKLEGFKEKIERMQNKNDKLIEEKEGLIEENEKIQSKLNNKKSIEKIKI